MGRTPGGGCFVGANDSYDNSSVFDVIYFLLNTLNFNIL